MSRYPSVPDFASTADSMFPALRAVKDNIEQLTGKRQGASLGAPEIFIQNVAPNPGAVALKRGDLWINEVSNKMSFWSGQVWVELA